MRCARLAAAAAFTLLAACSGKQSALDPAGREAHRIADLFWWMAAGTVVVEAIMIWIAWSAIRSRASTFSERQARLYIIGGGALFPTLVLAGLLFYGLGLIPQIIARAPEGSLTIKVTGKQWWWRVHYELTDGGQVELANEVRMPVGETIQFVLESGDVIHSFWIPSMGGKMDMIPGRTTHLALRPERTGTFRGVCAEYCGSSHALMAFDVVVMEKQAFRDWLERQQQEAVGSSMGSELFLTNGCGACHTIRGTAAAGSVGPDLTHVGSRLSIGAGTLPNTSAAFRRWLEHTSKVKPQVLMPHFGMLPNDELDVLADYLESLQ